MAPDQRSFGHPNTVFSAFCGNVDKIKRTNGAVYARVTGSILPRTLELDAQFCGLSLSLSLSRSRSWRGPTPCTNPRRLRVLVDSCRGDENVPILHWGDLAFSKIGEALDAGESDELETTGLN